jgi:outer membrane protein
MFTTPLARKRPSLMFLAPLGPFCCGAAQRLLITLGLLTSWNAAFGQAQPELGGQPLWELGAFAGAVGTPAYPASEQRTGLVTVLPVVIYRGEVFRAERGSVGARLVHTADTEFDIGFSGSLPASSNDIALRKDMPDLGTLVEFGPRLKTVLARPDTHTQVRLELPVRSVLEWQGGVRSQGWAAEPELLLETRAPGSAWRLSSSASLVIGDTSLNRYFYGVSVAHATPARPAYEASAGVIAARLSVSASRALSPDVRIFGFARAESYAASANAASPLHARDNDFAAGVGLTWTLMRSQERAP